MKIQQVPALRILKSSFKGNENKNIQKSNFEQAKPYIYSAAALTVAVGGYLLCRKPNAMKQVVQNSPEKNIANTVKEMGSAAKESITNISEKSKEKCGNILKNVSSHFAKNTYKQELEQLNNLSSEEKKYFINLYEAKTGFPNLEKVTNNIRKHLTNVLNKAEHESNTRIVFSSYDKNCSIGRNLALPGTDVDEWGLVIDGSQEQINKFKEVLYASYDQNIVNLICDHPKVYSLEELKNYLKKIDEITNTPEFKEKSEQFLKNMNEYTGSKEKTEFLTNSMFNIMLSDKFPDEATKIRAALDLSSTLETLRDGKVLINNLSNEEKNLIENSSLYKYGNFLQQRWRNSLKSKHAARIDFDKKYQSFDDDKKIRLIKEFINASFNNKPPKGSEFTELFNNTNGVDQSVLDTVSRILNKKVNGPV